MTEALSTITSSVKDVCGKLPTERIFLDKYGRICLCLDVIVWKVSPILFTFKLQLIVTQEHTYSVVLSNSELKFLKGLLENTEKERIKRLMRLKPPTEF